MKAQTLVAVLLLAAGCGSDLEPLGPGDGPPATTVDPSAGRFRIAVSAPAEGEGIILDGVDFVFDANRGEISFRAALVNSTDRPLFAPIQLILADIRPAEITAVDADGTTADGRPFYDFSDELGREGVLEPGEMSDRLTMTFSDPERLAFALGAVLSTGPGPANAAIGGVAYFDLDRNGRRDRGERGVPGVHMILHAGSRVVDETRTDGMGRYVFLDLEPGLYAVSKEPRAATTTPNPLHVALVPGEGGRARSFLAADFGCLVDFPPPPSPSEPIFGPLEVLANGETIHARFELDHVARVPLLLVVEVMGSDPSHRLAGSVVLNGRPVVTGEDLNQNPRGVRREIPPELLRVGANSLEVTAISGGMREVFLIVTILEFIREPLEP
jgi:hypothetical protein